jgi:NAD(P)-dependent dehydrogenase (short-subunit alcohol dehydrogenase family)
MLPTYATYVATKGAVEQMSHIFAKEMGTRGIRVNVVSPGPTDTELFNQGKSEEDRQRMAKWLLSPGWERLLTSRGLCPGCCQMMPAG